MKNNARSRYTAPTGRTVAYILLLAIIGLIAYFADGVFRGLFIAADVMLFLIGALIAAGDHFGQEQQRHRGER